MRESYRQVRGLVARLNAFLQEHITGISTVQLFAEEPRTFQKFDAINRGHRDVNIASIFYYAVFYPAIEVLAALSGALIIWIGGGWSLDGVVSVGVLVAFLQVLAAVLPADQRPVREVQHPAGGHGGLRADLHAARHARGADAADRGDAAPGGARAAASSSITCGSPTTEDHYVLRDVSFVVEPGQRIGIVGATGSGKTTLISLLLRFYDVNRGRILVDGVDIRELDMADLRGLVGLVLQDVHLFSGTIAGNIRLGQTSIDDEAVRRAATAVHADAFIRALPEGYASAVAERGATLSTGQKQLLAFARALAFEPAVLVLDEATSNIDTATEALIQDALKVLMAGRTVLAIAHRLSTIQDMDRILVLHKGELRESGTHQELLAQRGLYHRLYQLQFRDQMPARAGYGYGVLIAGAVFFGLQPRRSTVSRMSRRPKSTASSQFHM